MAALVAGLAAVVLITLVTLDAFVTVVLPRRALGRLRLTMLFYRVSWTPLAAFARTMEDDGRRELVLSFYGPLSLLVLLVLWAVALVAGFGILLWALGSLIGVPEGAPDLVSALYLSGTTFFTLGLGDVAPQGTAERLLTVVEAGTGFAFLALIIGYLPMLYGAFSSRETNISLLDARAGSPPTAFELLRRFGKDAAPEEIGRFLSEWERWCAELLESHLSYPVLGFYRSQHERQSWLAALTCVLDTCALIIAGIDAIPPRQSKLTFAMARHAAVDLSQVFHTPPRPPSVDRLPPARLPRLRTALLAAGLSLRDGPEAEEQLTELRRQYEPYLHALSHHLLMPLPPWMPATESADAWETSGWETGSPGGSRL
jgi:hypothetical protein